MDSSSQNYQYCALPQGPFFRYLLLNPGQRNEPLECSIHNHSLDQSLDYEAISYVWGPPIRNKALICDGQILKITQSLSNVLKRLRLRSEPRALWADSISINQEDLQEKGREVALMARIYQGAKRTLICLGDEGNGHAETAFELIEEINTRIVKICKRNDKPWVLFPHLDPEDPILRDTRWKSMTALYSNSWFGRGWTVQEAALAHEGLVIWGQHEIGWAKLMRVDVWATWRASSCVQTYDVGAPALHWYKYFSRHQNEARFFWETKDSPTLRLLETLESARVLGLTDPRDRIYAFLELLISDDEEGPETDLKLQPTYELDFLDLYKDFAMEHIRRKRKVELLDYVQHTQQTLNTELPSWVPRWDIRLEAGCRLYLSLWQALTDRSCSVHSPSMTETSLRVRGIVLDSIIYVSEVLRPPQMTLDDIAKVWKALVRIDAPNPYPPFCRLCAFIATLSGDILQGDLDTFHSSQAAYLLEIHQKSGELEAIDDQYWKKTAEGGNMNSFQSLIHWLLCGKKIFLTQRGYFGAAYDVVHEGDRCGIMFGCKTPSILRHTAAKNSYRLLGGAYIVGKSLQITQEKFRGFTLLGRKESKDWTEWNVPEDDIVLR